MALPNAGHGAGGPGNQSSGTINVNSGADPFLTLDPQQAAVAGSGAAPGPLGVNQLAGYISDTAGDALPLFAEFVYTPLYLYPR